MHTQNIFYPPPNEDRIKTQITGDLANLPSGLLITNAEMKNFSVAGGPPQLIAKTPACTFDMSTSQINSSNILQARTGDGNFYLEGVGFMWRKTAPDLTLSNSVHTIIHQPPATNNADGKTNSEPVRTDVYSDHGTFDTKSGLIVYYDHVLVTDPRLHLTSAILTVQLAQVETNNNKLDNIVAETNVVIDYTDESGRLTHATSDKAVYTRTTDLVTNEVLTLTGNPRLETTNGWATADLFVINLTTRTIQGSNNCYFHSSSALESTSTTTNKAQPPTVITADHFDYDMKTAVAVFHNDVTVDNPQLKLVCETLTAQLPHGESHTNDLEYIVAEKNVAIDYFDDQGERTHATAEKAVYSSAVIGGVTNKVLDLTGNPVLERTNGWIMADFISMDRFNGTIRGEGNHHTIYKKQPGHITKDAPPAAADTEIFSDHFDYNRATGIAFYRGNARVLDPQMRLQCRQITVKLPADAGSTNHSTRPERIVAETNVIVDYFTEKGDKTHATGEMMVFTHTVTNGSTTNEVLELTGNPVIDMTDIKGDKTHAVGDKVTYTSTTARDKIVERVVLSGHPRVERSDGATMTSDEVIVYDRLTGQVHGIGPQNHISYILKPKPPAKTNQPPALTGGAVPAH